MFRLPEKYFAVLRGPLESGRQHPNNLGAMLILSVFLQALLFVLVYIVGADRSIFPSIEKLRFIHLIITIVLVIFSLIYAIPSIFMRQQKIQYLITILVSQNLFGFLPLMMALFFLGKGDNISAESLLLFTYCIVGFGLLIFIITSIRFYILLRKGAYRSGGKIEQKRTNIESNIKSLLPIIIVVSLGVVYTLQYLIRSFNLYDFEIVFLATVAIIIFFAMLFILPEQLVILYCKYRFDSFNYNKKGDLKPMGRKGA